MIRADADGREHAGAWDSSSLTEDFQLSASRAAQHVHELGDLTALLSLVTAGNGILDAIGNMVAQDFLLHPAQRGVHGGNLSDYVDTITVLFDHAGETTNLAFDPPQAFKD